MTNKFASHVGQAQRYGPSDPCPVCGGHPHLPRGRSVRCYGFTSSDGRYAHCTRLELAGELHETAAGTFPHRLEGECRCGKQHGSAPIPARNRKPVVTLNRSPMVRRIWSDSKPAVGTPVESYLRFRGLTLPIPATLRFAILRHGPTERRLPTMVAAVQKWPVIEPVAVHRTFLATDGKCKADVAIPKMAYGPIRGGAIRLAPAESTLLIGEGIETALSGQQETGIPAWAAICASNMPHMILPELPLARLVIIAADGDGAGLRAAECAAESWARQGRNVRIAVPPPGKDLNDLLRREL